MRTPSRQPVFTSLIALIVGAVLALASPVPGAAEQGDKAAATEKTSDVAKPAAPAAPVTAPKNALDDMPSYGEALVRMIVVLVSILIALIVLGKLLPRWIGKPVAGLRGDTIKVIDSLALEPRKRVYLLKVGEQFFLVGTSETGVHMLSDKPVVGAGLEGAEEPREGASVAPAPSASVMRSFAAALSGKTGSTQSGPAELAAKGHAGGA